MHLLISILLFGFLPMPACLCCNCRLIWLHRRIKTRWLTITRIHSQTLCLEVRFDATEQLALARVRWNVLRNRCLRMTCMDDEAWGESFWVVFLGVNCLADIVARKKGSNLLQQKKDQQFPGDLTCIRTNSDWVIVISCDYGMFKAYFISFILSFTLKIMWRFSCHEGWWISSFLTFLLMTLTSCYDTTISGLSTTLKNHTTAESFQPAR